MSGTLHTDVVEKADGSPVDLTGQRASKGDLAYDMHTASVLSSFNTTSVVDNGTGSFTWNLTNSFISASEFKAIGTSDDTFISGAAYSFVNVNSQTTAPTASSTRFRTRDQAGGTYDMYRVCLTANGDLS